MTISQREARRLQKRVKELEDVLDRQRNAWASEWPGGTHLGGASWDAESCTVSAIFAARKLKHAVVVVADSNYKALRFYALPLGSRT